MILDSRGNPLKRLSSGFLDSVVIASLVALRENFDIARRFENQFVKLYDDRGHRITSFVSHGKIGDTIHCRLPIRFRSA